MEIYWAAFSQFVEIASWTLIGVGSFFVIVGAIGLVRMPDVYTRMHASSVTETLCACLLLIGLLLQSETSLTTFKLLTILGLVVFVGPVITHALAQAALHAGVKPLLVEDRQGMVDAKPVEPSAGGESSAGRRS